MMPNANRVPIDTNRPSPDLGPGHEPAYRRAVAHGGLQTWTEQDERDLRAKVRRLARPRKHDQA